MAGAMVRGRGAMTASSPTCPPCARRSRDAMLALSAAGRLPDFLETLPPALLWALASDAAPGPTGPAAAARIRTLDHLGGDRRRRQRQDPHRGRMGRRAHPRGS